MARIFITGTADGLGKLAAGALIADGHEVILHARSQKRIRDSHSLLPGAAGGASADLSIMNEVISLAEAVNKLGPFDAVIHNAALGDREHSPRLTPDGLPEVFAVNSIAPYILTALIKRPKRLVYLSSGLHSSGDASLKDVTWEKRRWSGFQAYSDSKLHDLILSQAAARLWPDVYSNAVDPGWVATKMGGAGAPDDLDEGYRTQCWLATSNDKNALTSGQYFYHRKSARFLKAAADFEVQEKFLEICREITGIALPKA